MKIWYIKNSLHITKISKNYLIVYILKKSAQNDWFAKENFQNKQLFGNTDMEVKYNFVLNHPYGSMIIYDHGI